MEDSGIEVEGYKFYGSPWSPRFFDWAFNADIGDDIQKWWDKIPTETDILITHGPPHKILDQCRDGYNAGCPILLKEIQTRIKPMYHIFGHIHEAYGMKKVRETTFINASSVTLDYKPFHSPIVFELPVRN